MSVFSNTSNNSSPFGNSSWGNNQQNSNNTSNIFSTNNNNNSNVWSNNQNPSRNWSNSNASNDMNMQRNANDLEKQEYGNRLQAIYEKCEPNKIKKIGGLINKYSNTLMQLHSMYIRVCKKYNQNIQQIFISNANHSNSNLFENKNSFMNNSVFNSNQMQNNVTFPAVNTNQRQSAFASSAFMNSAKSKEQKLANLMTNISGNDIFQSSGSLFGNRKDSKSKEQSPKKEGNKIGYSLRSQLSDKDIQAFEAPNFSFNCIPIKPPPYELA